MSTTAIPSRVKQLVVVVMPDGYRVRLGPEFVDERAVFGQVVWGIGEQGEKVAVRGNHIARVWREEG